MRVPNGPVPGARRPVRETEMTGMAIACLLAALAAVVWGYLERRRRVELRREVARSSGYRGQDLSTPAIARYLERSQTSAATCRTERDVLAMAVRSIDLGVRVVGLDRTELAANRFATEVMQGRQGLALVRSVSERLCSNALAGVAGSEPIQIVGPPLRSFRVAASPLVIEGSVAGAVVVYTDTTNDDRVSQVRRDFVANLSHELKTPVAAIGLLVETLDGEPDQAVRDRLLASVSTEAERVAAIIDDLLDLSRLEFERDIRKERVNAYGVIAEARDRVALQAKARDVDVEVMGDTDLTVDADRDLLVHAVANLLDNAIKYSPESSRVQVGAEFGDDVVEIYVRDQGVGIPSDDLERIFERFYRVDRARSRATGGTGLGLSIVRHVAANHGGDVRVVSREGVGSTFTISIPEESSDGS